MMRRPSLPSSFRRLALGLLGAALALAAAPMAQAQGAGPATPAGTEIVSMVELTWRIGGQTPGMTLTASARITVQEWRAPPIDLQGRLFDSRSGGPISGVEVTLIDMATGLPALINGADRASGFPSRLTSGSTIVDTSGHAYELLPGGFRFPDVAPGIYRLEVVPPETHHAPSARPDLEIQGLPGGPFALVPGSRLEPFELLPGPAPRIDIPLEPVTMMQVARDATTASAGIGDFLEYIVTVTPADTMQVEVIDTLPPGVAYLAGTMLIDGLPVTPQVVGGGGQLRYLLPDPAIGRPITITYGAQVTPAARVGRTLESRSAVDAAGNAALTARHALRVHDTLGLDRVAILGQISAGGCGGQDPGHDLSGIRVLLENGEFAITDSDGRFTFRDIYRRPRVVQIDVTTLPAGARPVLCFPSTRSAGSAISQFVELRPGMMGRVEFYLEFDDDPPLPASRLQEPPAAPRAASPLVQFDQAWLDRNAAGRRPGFVAPGNGHLPRSEAVDIVYLRPVGARSELTVNGEPVPPLRREPGIRASNGRMELVRYRAVRVAPGRNSLRLVITGADGAVLVDQMHEVLYGLRPHRLELVRAASVLETDGRSEPQITLRLTDREGVPIRPGSQVTLAIEQPFGFAPPVAPRRGTPASDRQPGNRKTVEVGEDGLIQVTLAPVLESGTARLSVLGSTSRATSLRVPISAAARPWVLVGLAEGTLAHSRVREHMRRDGEIGNALAGRVAFFAEGVIRGEWLLTLRYDTAQDRDGFYGIDPDADYIVYGDRSVQGSAAQSRFPLYLRLRREGAEFLIGDFNTDLNASGVRINQQVTGARAVFEDEHWRVMAFAAPVSNALIEDRIPLNGTVGPYALSRTDIVPHSQTVRLVTVSRFDASEELESTTLRPGLDYVLSFNTGQIFLRRPLPAVTPSLDRLVLVVDYEADAELRDGLIAGIRAEGEFGPRLRAGATAVHARRVEGRDLAITLLGADFSYAVTDNLTLGGEVLHATRRFATHVDTGLRAELRAEYERDDTRITAYLRRQRGHVALTGSDRPIDTTIASLVMRLALPADPDRPADRWFLDARLKAENDRAGALRRRDGEVVLTRERERVSQSLGLRALHLGDASGRGEDLRLVWRGAATSEDGRLTLGLGTEITLTGDRPRAADQLTMTVGYALTERLALFGTFEVESPRAALTDARRLTFGAEFSPVAGQSYRSALSWARNGARWGHALFLGADHVVPLREGLTAHLGGDLQWDLGAAGVPMGTSIGNPYIEESFLALRAGLRRETATWGAGIDTEWRRSRAGQQGNLRFRMDAELDESWTIGGEMLWGLARSDARGTQHDRQLRLSAARRSGPRDPITLLQAEWRDRDEGGIAGTTALASIYRTQYLSDKDFLNLRYGLKVTEAGLRTGRERDVLHLIGAEYRRDLSERFDLGLHAAMLQSSRSNTRQTSLGISLGITPFENGWLSLGYNFVGFHDRDFSAHGHTDRGPFVQFRIKLDADTVRRMFR